MPQHIQFRTVKGGQGCTTTVALTAAALVAGGKRVLVVDWAHSRDDIYRALGTAVGGQPELATTVGKIHVTNNYDWANNTHQYDLVLWDRGNGELDCPGTEWWVTTNCYLAMSKLINHARERKRPISRLVAIIDPRRPLTSDDIAAAVGMATKILILDHDMAIARAVDAGLLLTRTPSTLLTQRLIDTFGEPA